VNPNDENVLVSNIYPMFYFYFKISKLSSKNDFICFSTFIALKIKLLTTFISQVGIERFKCLYRYKYIHYYFQLIYFYSFFFLPTITLIMKKSFYLLQYFLRLSLSKILIYHSSNVICSIKIG